MKANININVLKPTDKAIGFMESLRYEAHNYPKPDNPLNSYYAIMLKEGRMLVYAVLVNNVPVAGAYVSSVGHSIFIEHVFVKPELQRTEFHFGSNLIRFIISQRSELETYFNEQFNSVRIEYINDETKQIYQNLQFRESKMPGQLFKLL